MKKITRWFRDFFAPEEFNDMDTAVIGEAFNDSSVRVIWLNNCFDEIKRINLEVDKRLLSGSNLLLTDLCARRRAYQDIFESVLSARRQVTGTQAPRHNPRPEFVVDLDRVTA